MARSCAARTWPAPRCGRPRSSRPAVVAGARPVPVRVRFAGAAVRDLDSRTYAAASVRLAHLDLSALDVCVAMAVSSGSAGLEAAVVLADGDPALDAVRDFAGAGVPVHLGDARGAIARSLAA